MNLLSCIKQELGLEIRLMQFCLAKAAAAEEKSLTQSISYLTCGHNLKLLLFQTRETSQLSANRTSMNCSGIATGANRVR